ncbi:hypothetical protein [Nocardia sp. NPDC057440]|uniref:hypothetical protein n=1 Tax=Nocardia sp. NPDC057440 TaxID=3346134 RepID=UPI00366D43BC
MRTPTPERDDQPPPQTGNAIVDADSRARTADYQQQVEDMLSSPLYVQPGNVFGRSNFEENVPRPR